MASIQKEMTLAQCPDRVWAAVRDVGAIHTRLATGFVTATELEGDVRTVTFANGAVAREQIIDCDDAGRRLVWSVVGAPFVHHNGAIQVEPAGDGCRLRWIADLLPNDLAPRIDGLMTAGMAAMKRTLEAA